MNPIVKAIDEIKFVIPDEILRTVFTREEFYMCSSPISMETRIREQVIDARVLVDMDIMGGTDTYISLAPPVGVDFVDPYTAVYYIPDEVTQNRPIRHVYSIHFGILGHATANAIYGSNTSILGNEVRKVFDSAAKSPPASTSYLNLINHNSFMVKFSHLPYASAYAKVRLGNDDALNFIRPQSIPLVADLCKLAIKSYIYNKMRVKIDQAYLSGGQELGAYKDTVMEYSDAEEMYQEKLKVWKNIAHNFNDPEAKRRAIRTIVGAP